MNKRRKTYQNNKSFISCLQLFWSFWSFSCLFPRSPIENSWWADLTSSAFKSQLDSKNVNKSWSWNIFKGNKKILLNRHWNVAWSTAGRLQYILEQLSHRRLVSNRSIPPSRGYSEIRSHLQENMFCYEFWDVLEKPFWEIHQSEVSLVRCANFLGRSL